LAETADSAAPRPGQSWAIVPAAGRGQRFGGQVPKQYVMVDGRPLITHALGALLAHPGVAGAVVVLSADDPHWPGWESLAGKPIRTCIGGEARADSVLAGLAALPDSVRADDFVLVHDAARPLLREADLDALLERGRNDPVGAILAAPVRDTLKRADAQGRSQATEPREALWRALTPQLFRRGSLVRALEAARRAGVHVTDEAMAIERLGLRPRLVEGRDDNLKITTPADLALAEFILSRRSVTNADQSR
jgi:2-C-methyl-D-erythritol 4-phosphate cytidylyltransferase